MRVEIETIISTLQENTDFCIYTHIKPDGDAVGSAFGLALALQKLGKKVCVRCQDPWPQKFQDLVEEFVPDIVKDEVGIAVDVSSAQRLGIYEKADILLCIDHHMSNPCLFENTFLKDEVSCTSIIFRLLEKMMCPVPADVRKYLFVGLLTDSDGFKSSAVTYRAFADAADMISTDLSPTQVIKKYYSSKTNVELECEKVLLENLEFFYNNRVAITFLPENMHRKIGFGNTDSLVGLAVGIEGVELGLTIVENEACDFSLSIRSNGNWDASLLARSLGGGGHKSAAGAGIKGRSKSEVLEEIKREIELIYLN